MKVNNRTYPALNKIIKNDKAENFKIYHISKNLTDKILEASDKIADIVRIEDFKEIDSFVILDHYGIYVIYVDQKNERTKIEVYHKNGKKEENEEFRDAMLIYAYQALLFIKYAEIETKMLPPKTPAGIKCKYSNHSKYPVTFIDSTWFTNLVKSDAFKVSGHFRLQPYADGSKKLIWISDYMKKGYTAPAKKLKNNFKKS